MGTNTSGLRRGNPVKEEERLYIDMQKPLITPEEEKDILREIKWQYTLYRLMQPGKDYAIL